MLRYIYTFVAIAACMCCLPSCATKSHFTHVEDLPLKDTKLPSMTWQEGPLRANAQYVLYGAQSGKDMRDSLGDYYFVQWYDATPTLPTCVQMLYTQAITASQVQKREICYKTPRRGRATHKELISFKGPARAKAGDILSWRLNLIVDGKIVDSRRSYLWEDEK